MDLGILDARQSAEAEEDEEAVNSTRNDITSALAYASLAGSFCASHKADGSSTLTPVNAPFRCIVASLKQTCSQTNICAGAAIFGRTLHNQHRGCPAASSAPTREENQVEQGVPAAQRRVLAKHLVDRRQQTDGGFASLCSFPIFLSHTETTEQEPLVGGVSGRFGEERRVQIGLWSE